MNRRTFLKLLGGTGLIASYPLLVERSYVQINHYWVTVAGLPDSFNGFTIAHLTDIHFGPLVSENFVKKIIDRTNSLGADAIFCTGDYVHAKDSSDEIDQVWHHLMRLRAKNGVYSVLGNHDHWADSERSLYWLEKSGQSVRHKTKTITRAGEKIVIGGCGDYWEDNLEIDQTFGATAQSDCKILLTHNPDSIDTEFTSSVALFISGHTHGGQVVLPFTGPPVLPVQNKKYSSGLINTRKGPLFISRGLGWAIVPVRFNCYPEIAVLELVG